MGTLPISESGSLSVREAGVTHILPLLVIIAAVGIISFLIITSTLPIGGFFGILNPKSQSKAAAFGCTLFLGYSQTNNWFPVFHNIMGNTYELQWVGGGAAGNWLDPNYPGWTSSKSFPCSQNSSTPDRVVFDITHYAYLDTDPDPVGTMESIMRQLLPMIRSHFPSAQIIGLQPVTGGPGHSICPFGSTNVRASVNHPYIHQAIDRVVASPPSGLGVPVFKGNDSQLGNCSMYADDIGHLNGPGAGSGQDYIGAQAANYFSNLGGASPTPTPTPAPSSSPSPSPTTIPNTIGYTRIGQSVDSGASNFMNGMRQTVGGTNPRSIVSMSVYVASVDTAPNNQYQLAIYNDNVGNPSTLLVASSIGTLTANAWNTRPISVTLQPNTAYWFMYNTNGRSGAVNNMRYDTPASDRSAFSTGTTNFGTWPANFGPVTFSNLNYSLYATYNPNATPAPSPTPSCPLGSLGDTDCNGDVDIFDYNALVANFNKTGTNIPGDLDKDGDVDIFDYNIIVTNFGRTS